MSLRTAVGARRRSVGVVAAAGLVMAVLSACGSSQSAGSGGNVVATGAPVPLVVYSAQGYDQAMVTAFQKATGIPTKLVDDSTGPLLARVQAERGNPQWGVLWVDGDEAFAALDQAGMLVKNFEPNVQLNTAGQAVVPKDKSYVPTGLTVTAALVYDASKTANPPTSWQDLLSPAWKGAVGMNDPAVSGPTYPFVAGMFNQLGGDSQGEAFYSSLKSNGLHVFQTNGDTLHALQTGQIKVALIQSSAGIAAGIKDKNIKTTYLPKVTSLPSVIGIDGKVSAQEQAEAEKFASFVLSPKGQEVMLTGDRNGDSLYWPIVQGVTPDPELPALASVPTQAIDPYVWGPKEGTVNTWFTNTIVH
ncbi:ABC transporter substrate-binding protein [Streptacidiphilus anmyonensis]|uniref:ABC transporter substrate-binding protein n=1 Tax=Streptacidiphilus anmyonensis TaxID=405782 RepID=UPI000A022D41|nr:extracellular solute-binding protein [Streptacidiphilus anmyonensis]